jgi:hypothetical protein
MSYVGAAKHSETLSHHHKRQARGEQGARHKKEQHIMNIPILVASLMTEDVTGFDFDPLPMGGRRGHNHRYDRGMMALVGTGAYPDCQSWAVS